MPAGQPAPMGSGGQMGMMPPTPTMSAPMPQGMNQMPNYQGGAMAQFQPPPLSPYQAIPGSASANAGTDGQNFAPTQLPTKESYAPAQSKQQKAQAQQENDFAKWVQNNPSIKGFPSDIVAAEYKLEKQESALEDSVYSKNNAVKAARQFAIDNPQMGTSRIKANQAAILSDYAASQKEEEAKLARQRALVNQKRTEFITMNTVNEKLKSDARQDRQVGLAQERLDLAVNKAMQGANIKPGTLEAFAAREQTAFKPLDAIQQQGQEVRGLIASASDATMPQIQKLLTNYINPGRVTNMLYGAEKGFGTLPDRLSNAISRFATGGYSEANKNEILKLVDDMDKNVFDKARSNIKSRFKKQAEIMGIDPAMADYDNAYNDSGQSTNAGAPPVPAVGTIDGGYKFKGGNPADQSNWVKQ
jgi:hypothetical protein